MSAQKCPGRTGCRRKKVLYCCLLGAFFLGVLQLVGIPGDYSSPMPLQDAQSEARRLLKFITQYHVQCNLTLQLGSSNRSHWPLCVDRDLGTDLDSKTPKAGLVLGTQYDLDLSTEQYLTTNDSFHLLLVSDSSPFPQMNNSFAINSIIVPNDPADFGRNSYDQMTMNTLLQRYGVQHLDLMRLAATADDISMWEMLHFMSEDNLLLKVQQLHLAMYIDKLDEDLLYNWYRTLHSLFYTQGMRLYHTSSRDPLCLQVTLMESCMYFLSFIHDPGPRFFIMYPPADLGAAESEQSRLIEYMDAPSEKCSTQALIGRSVICQSLIHPPCTFYLFRSSYSHKNDAAYFNKNNCDVHILVPQANEVFTQYSSLYASNGRKPISRNTISSDSFIANMDHGCKAFCSQFIDIECSGQEWRVLSLLLDNTVLKHVTLINIRITSWTSTSHPSQLRSEYSQLQRLESLGFHLYYSNHDNNRKINHIRHSRKSDFLLSFLKNVR